MNVRLAQAQDLDQLVCLRRDFTLEDDPEAELVEGYETECRTFLEHALTGERWRIFLAEADGKVVSHAYVELVAKVPRPTREAPHWGYVTNVYTVPAQRGKGIGAAVLGEVTAWADQAALELLIVWPSDESRSFYARHGFADADDPMIRPAGG